MIAQAEQKADVVVCCVHWGTEYSYTLEEVQRSTARTYIDAGGGRNRGHPLPLPPGDRIL